MVELVRDPDEVALLRVLLDAPDGDHMTLIDLVAVASATAGQRVEWFEASRLVTDLFIHGQVSRTVVRRRGHPKQQAYALNGRGRRRVTRMLGLSG
jgi:hypothetical protein